MSIQAERVFSSRKCAMSLSRIVVYKSDVLELPCRSRCWQLSVSSQGSRRARGQLSVHVPLCCECADFLDIGPFSMSQGGFLLMRFQALDAITFDMRRRHAKSIPVSSCNDFETIWRANSRSSLKEKMWRKWKLGTLCTKSKSISCEFSVITVFWVKY